MVYLKSLMQNNTFIHREIDILRRKIMRRMNYDRFAKPYNFGEYDPERVEIISDICATAKGYESLAKAVMKNA